MRANKLFRVICLSSVFSFILWGCVDDIFPCGGRGECCCDPDDSCDDGLTCTFRDEGGGGNPFSCSSTCEPPCEPDCSDRECGPDPRCGESCGECSASEICEFGKCKPRLCETTLVGSIDIPGEAGAVQVSGNYAYFAATWGVAANWGGFHIIDISDPWYPRLAGSHESSEGSFSDVVVSGNHAFLVDQGGDQLQIFDVSNPNSPNPTSAFSAADPHAVFVTGDYAYLADGYSGLKIIDVSDPSSPSLSSSFDVLGTAEAIFVAGNYAYLSGDSQHFFVIDVSDPYSPSLVGSTGSLENRGVNIHVIDNIAYIVTNDYYHRGAFEIIDVSKPSAPKKLASYETTCSTNDVFVSGKNAFIADGESGLKIVDVTDPSSPHLAGSIDLDGKAMGVFVSGEFVYIADRTKGLMIIESPDCH